MIRKITAILLSAAVFLFCACKYGDVGDADITGTYFPGDSVFEERLDFLRGVWYSRDAGIGLLDGYRVQKWENLTAADKAKALALFPALSVDSPKTYSSGSVPKNSDYILLYDDTLYGLQDDTGGQKSWGFSFMGLVRAINIFNNDLNRGAVIIEYFEKADPEWLSDPGGFAYQGLAPGENPFFGVYHRVLSSDDVQMSNAIDLTALNAGEPYYTEKKTLAEAINFFNVVNEAEFISWGVVIPHQREK